MSAVSKSRRNAFLIGAGLLVFGIIQLAVAYDGYRAHQMIPGGEGHDFMTPTQGLIVAGIALAFAAYAFARGLVAKRDDT